MWILDTNVVSELMRPEPESGVMEWLGSRPGGSLFLTSVVEAELRYALALLPAGRRGNDLTAALEDISSRISLIVSCRSTDLLPGRMQISFPVVANRDGRSAISTGRLRPLPVRGMPAWRRETKPISRDATSQSSTPGGPAPPE